jgi:hypothetical protein
MKKQIVYLLLTGALLATPALLTTGCAVARGNQTAGAYAKDKQINARVKTAMYADPLVKGTEVEVITLNGVVQLSGFVNNAAEKERAGEIAASVPGVVKVYNNIILPTGSETGHRPSAPISEGTK